MSFPVLETPRLRLRIPEERDFPGFLEMMTDEVAARWIGGALKPPLVWRSMCMLIGHWHVRGFGMFSVEHRETGEWLGRVGPWYPYGWSQPEVGWGLARRHQGHGYAMEAAIAALDFAFDELGWAEVIHLIHPENVPSQRLAARLGSVDTGRDEAVAGYENMVVDVWGQTAVAWRAHRASLARR